MTATAKAATRVSECAALLLEAVSAFEMAKQEDKTTKAAAEFFRMQGRVVVRALSKHKSAFRESAESELVAAVNEAIDSTAKQGQTFIQHALVTGYEWGYTDLADSLDLQDAFSLSHPEAVQWAERTAADQVTKVNKTTKKHIKNIVVHGLENGESYDSVARSITNQFEEFAIPKPQHHIQSRAHLVAIQENAMAFEGGGKRLVDDVVAVGIDMEVSWGGPDDSHTSDGCRDNMAVGWIPVNTAFPSGDLHPPRFPGCRHHANYRVARDQEDKLRAVKGGAA